MDRREFLKFMTAGAAALAVPLAVPEALLLGEEMPKSLIVDFDPSKEYGIALSYVPKRGRIDNGTYRMLQDTLIADARRQLPEGTRFEIREKIPTDFGRNCGMGWYTHAGLRVEPLRNWDTPWLARVDQREGCYIPETGVYIVGRQIA